MDKYVQKRLKMCKSCGGPAVSLEKLFPILKAHPNQKEVIVRTEFTLESHTILKFYLIQSSL